MGLYGGIHGAMAAFVASMLYGCIRMALELPTASAEYGGIYGVWVPYGLYGLDGPICIPVPQV